MRILFLALLQLLVCSIISAATLKEQCEKLDAGLKKAYVNGTCFVITQESSLEGFNTWNNMAKYCNHLPENHGRMATITTKEELDELYRQNIFEITEWAYIGALQDPSDADTCGIDAGCGPDVHKRDWWFIDEKGNKRAKLNAALWSSDQPDNNAFGVNENAVALQRTSYGIVMHDCNPSRSEAPVLCQYQDVETLKQKCLQLDPSLRKAFVGRSCFVASTKKTIEGYNTYRNVRKHCDHMPGFRARLATINKKQQIDELVKQKVIVAGDELLIGAVQDPSDQGRCGKTPCGPEIHKNDWYYIDEHGKRLEPLNGELWAKGEPNNYGETPFANAVSIRASPNSPEVALNDASPKNYAMNMLCQYDL